MYDQPPIAAQQHRPPRRLASPGPGGRPRWSSFAAGLAFLVGVAAWSHDQFLWPDG